MKRVGSIEGVRIYESKRMGIGARSATIALPGYGIIVGIGVYSNQEDLYTVLHEYGHFLQARIIGVWRFYLQIGLPSLMSAWLNWHGKGHQCYWTELWCNHLVKNRYKAVPWPEHRFPSSDLTDQGKFWLGVPANSPTKQIS